MDKGLLCAVTVFTAVITARWLPTGRCFFLFSFFFPHQCSSSITCTKPWSLCWSHSSVSRRRCAMFKAEHSADHNREDTQGLRNDEQCKAHKGGYCMASSLTGYCLKHFEANNDKPHSILYIHQPLYWYINAMEHSRLSAMFYRWFWQITVGLYPGRAYARLGRDRALPKIVLAPPTAPPL